jgi:hypothetical protein
MTTDRAASDDQSGRLGEQMVVRVERLLPGWLERRAQQVASAWGVTDADERLRDAAVLAAARVTSELRALVAAHPIDQRVTPLEVVRSAHREPTRVLADLGVAPIVRDRFEERAQPDDRYGLTPRSFADLGDDELVALHLAWGAAKAAAVVVAHSRE